MSDCDGTTPAAAEPDAGADESGTAEGEEELVDEQAKFRNICRETASCVKMFEKLTTCNERVLSRTKTAETCKEEIIDYVHCVDHCASKRFFPLLK